MRSVGHNRQAGSRARGVGGGLRELGGPDGMVGTHWSRMAGLSAYVCICDIHPRSPAPTGHGRFYNPKILQVYQSIALLLSYLSARRGVPPCASCMSPIRLYLPDAT